MSFLTEALKLMELEGDPRNIATKLAQELHRGAASFLQNDRDTWTVEDFRDWIHDSKNNFDREELYADFPHFDSYEKYADAVVEILNNKGLRGVHGMTEMDSPDRVRSPSDEEYNKAAAAIKHENPALQMGGIGVDEETGDINIEAILRSGEHTASEHFILRANGKLDLVNEGFRKPFARGTRAQYAGSEGRSREDREDDEAREKFDREGNDWEIPGARDLANFGRRGNEEEEEDPNVRHARHARAYRSHEDRAHAALGKHHPDRQVHGIDDDPEKDDFHFYDNKGDDWSLDADDNFGPRGSEEEEMGYDDEDGDPVGDVDALDKLQKNRAAGEGDWTASMDDDVSPRDRVGAEEEEMIDVPCRDCGGRGSSRDREGNREDCDTCGGSGREDMPKYESQTRGTDMNESSRERLLHLAGITEGKLPAFLKGKGKDKDSDDDKDDGKKKKPAFLNGGDDDDKDSDDKDDDKKSDKKDKKKSDKDDDKSDKDDKKKDKKKTDEGLDRLRHLGGVALNEKKKPDADGDGVPDWADKKKGKDDKKADKKGK